MEEYDKNKESSYLKYWDVNNFPGWTMSQKVPVDDFEWVEYTSQYNEDLKKRYNEKSDEGYFLQHDVQYPKKLEELCNDLSLLPERMKIEKIGKLTANLYDKTEYVIYIRDLKQSLFHELVVKNVHRVIKFNQKAWIKPYNNMNSKLRKKAKNDFAKDFLRQE